MFGTFDGRAGTLRGEYGLTMNKEIETNIIEETFI